MITQEIILSDGSTWRADLTKVEENLQQFYRKPHDIEIKNYDTKEWQYMGDGYRAGPVRWAVTNSPENPNQIPMPEVYRLQWVTPQANDATLLACRWIRLWKDLNPKLSIDKFEDIVGDGYAFTNHTGWPGRYNCLTGEDAGEKNPAFHSPLICGGAVLKGTVVGSDLHIEGLLTSDPVTPTAQWVLERPWLWYYGVSIGRTGANYYMNKKGVDGVLYPIRVPILTKAPVKLPLSFLDKLPLGYIPPNPHWKP